MHIVYLMVYESAELFIAGVLDGNHEFIFFDFESVPVQSIRL